MLSAPPSSRRHAWRRRAGRDRPGAARAHPRRGLARRQLPARRHRHLPQVGEGAPACRHRATTGRGWLNGHVAEVVAIDPSGSRLWVEMEGRERQMLDLRHLADRHIRPGWVRTIHSSQGATCGRVMAHLESFRANTVDAASAYVAISRARTSATSTLTVAPASPMPSVCVMARRSGQSTRQ